MEAILNRAGVLPRIICSDRGGEFDCKVMKSKLKDLKIRQFLALSDHKASVCERFQQTLQSRLYSYLVANESYRYVDVLQFLVRNYNTTYHRSIGMSPVEAEDESNIEELTRAHAKLRSKVRLRKMKPRYKKGDVVRVSLSKSPFTRSYHIQQSHQRYIVKKVVVKHVVPLYILEDDKGVELTGHFYENQLTRVDIDTYRVNIIGQRRRRGKQEYKVHYVGYDNSYDEYLSKTQLGAIKPS
ncbi:MAG TPA: hypothetical protein EYO76_07440 [Flavobacteriaceae bacterium]|nr:hypothetical protein [Flavobacteriaceae bacterium]